MYYLVCLGHRERLDGIKMARFHSTLFVFFVMNGLATGLSQSSAEPRVSLGRLVGGTLIFEQLNDSKKVIRVPIESTEGANLCQPSECAVSWSVRPGGAWIAIRNLRSNKTHVISDSGRILWTNTLPFEARSMLSVSRDGKTVAVVGRVAGEEHIWHVDASGSRRMWSAHLKQYSGRLQVGWVGSSLSNVFSDGDMIRLCEMPVTRGCKPLMNGDLPSVSPDGRNIAALSDRKTVDIYDLVSNRVTARLVARLEWGHETPKWDETSKVLVLSEVTRKGSSLRIMDLMGKAYPYHRNTNNRTTAENGIVPSR